VLLKFKDMETEDFKYLNERLINQLEYYDRKAVANKKKYYRYKSAVIIISTSIPLIAILPYKEEANYIIAFLGASVAILTSLLELSKAYENWLDFRKTAETLKRERFFYENTAGPYSKTSDKNALMVRRVENIISVENDLWQINQKQENKEKELD
jgi:hypothetical protein